MRLILDTSQVKFMVSKEPEPKMDNQRVATSFPSTGREEVTLPLATGKTAEARYGCAGNRRSSGRD